MRIRNAGAQMLFKVAGVTSAVMNVGAVETIYTELATGLNILTKEARSSISDFAKALGIPDVKD